MTAIFVLALTHLGTWGLALAALVVFAESGLLAGFFLPGDAMLFSVGVLVSAGTIHVPLGIAVGAIALAAFLGDQLGYQIGRSVGPRLLSNPHSRFLNPAHVDRAHEFFVKHGPKAVVLARFVPIVRTLTPAVAGVGRMPRHRFVLFNLIGAVTVAALTICAGAALGGVPLVAQHIDLISLGLVAVSIVPIGLTALRARRSRRTRGAGVAADPVGESSEDPHRALVGAAPTRSH